MPYLAVPYPLHTGYEQRRKLPERNKTLVKSHHTHDPSPIAFAVSASAGVLRHYRQVMYLTCHHLVDLQASISQQCKRCSIKEQCRNIIINASHGFGVCYLVPQFVGRDMWIAFLFFVAVGNVRQRQKIGVTHWLYPFVLSVHRHFRCLIICQVLYMLCLQSNIGSCATPSPS